MHCDLAALLTFESNVVYLVVTEARRIKAFRTAPVSFRALTLNLAYVVG